MPSPENPPPTPEQQGSQEPVCIGGARKVPPESCRGAWHYQEMCQHFSFYYAVGDKAWQSGLF